MSSAVYIDPKKPIKLEDWLEFCKEHSIEYSPNTIGRNVFYWKGLGGVQIVFGKVEFENNTPPTTASKIIVSSFFGQNLLEIAQVFSYIAKRWSISWVADPEVKKAIKQAAK